MLGQAAACSALPPVVLALTCIRSTMTHNLLPAPRNCGTDIFLATVTGTWKPVRCSTPCICNPCLNLTLCIHGVFFIIPEPYGRPSKLLRDWSRVEEHFLSRSITIKKASAGGGRRSRGFTFIRLAL